MENPNINSIFVCVFLLSYNLLLAADVGPSDSIDVRCTSDEFPQDACGEDVAREGGMRG